MRALIYARVSLDTTGLARSVTEQETELRAWADREGWTVEKVIAETGSASRHVRSTQARKRWPELTAELATGAYDLLLTWENSRATRDLTEYAQLVDLCARHGVRWGYSGTVHDLTTREARFRTGLDALVSQDEAGRTSERVTRATRARAAAGLPHGKIPYGYRREYDPATGRLATQVPDETTAPIVREIVTRIAAGDSCYGVARDLTRRGIPLPRPTRAQSRPGGQTAWLSTTVRRIAASPTYVGRRVHRGQVIGDAAWPPLVDGDTWERAQASLGRLTSFNPSGDARAVHLLTGIARCGACGGPMRRLKNRGYATYGCVSPGCMRVAREMARTDEHVVARLLILLGEFHREDRGATDVGAVAEARAELAALEERLAGFADQAADGGLSPAALARVEARLAPQIRAARARLDALLVPSRLARWDLSDPPALWAGLGLDRRRDLLRQAVRVTIHPVGRGRRTWDPSGVEVTPLW